MAALAPVAPMSIGLPSTQTSPPSRGSRPQIIEIVVVLPAPFGPRSPYVSPAAISKPTPPTARRLPNVLRRPAQRRTGSPGAAPAVQGGTARRVPGGRPASLARARSSCPRHPSAGGRHPGRTRGARAVASGDDDPRYRRARRAGRAAGHEGAPGAVGRRARFGSVPVPRPPPTRPAWIAGLSRRGSRSVARRAARPCTGRSRSGQWSGGSRKGAGCRTGSPGRD